jgi:hypothetical protein
MVTVVEVVSLAHGMRNEMPPLKKVAPQACAILKLFLTRDQNKCSQDRKHVSPERSAQAPLRLRDSSLRIL